MKRQKINKGFWQSGYGRGFHKTAIVYLINGLCYAKCKNAWKTDMHPLKGELTGYVRVNASKNNVTGEYLFFQISGHGDQHLPFE